MDTNRDTSSELKMRLIEHIAGLLDDLEMDDDNQKDYPDAAIVKMHERNIDLAGLLVGSMGLSDAIKDEHGYTARVNLVEPHLYIDNYLKQPN
jgi:hypothetical protein